MTCPKCHSELKPETKFCAQCGQQWAVSSQNFKDEHAAEHEARDEAARPNRTRQIGSQDLSFQSPATPVQRLAGQGGGAPESDASPRKAPAGRSLKKGRAPRVPALLVAFAAVSVVVSVCTTLAVSRWLNPRPEASPAQAQQQPEPQPAHVQTPEPAQPRREPEQSPTSPGNEETINRRGIWPETSASAPAGEAATPAEDENDRLAREPAAKRQELASLNRQLEQATNRLAKINRGISKGKRELAETERSVREVRQELAKVESSLALLKTQVAVKRQELGQLEASIRRGRRENRQLKETLASRKREVKELDNEISRGERAARRLRKELDSIRTSAGR